MPVIPNEAAFLTCDTARAERISALLGTLEK